MTITRPNAGEYSARANTARTGRRTKVAFEECSAHARERGAQAEGTQGGALRARIQFRGNHRGATWRERGLFARARMQFCRSRNLRPTQGHAWGPIPTPLLARNLRPAQGNAFRRRRGGSEGPPCGSMAEADKVRRTRVQRDPKQTSKSPTRGTGFVPAIAARSAEKHRGAVGHRARRRAGQRRAPTTRRGDVSDTAQSARRWDRGSTDLDPSALPLPQTGVRQTANPLRGFVLPSARATPSVRSLAPFSALSRRRAPVAVPHAPVRGGHASGLPSASSQRT